MKEQLDQLVKFLEGKKTYLAAFWIAASAIVGLWSGAIDETNFIALFGIAMGFIGLRGKAQSIGTILENYIENQKAERAAMQASVAELKPLDFSTATSTADESISSEVKK